mmetsp:Transcript_128354/g.247393  ORF Transcript_128354/g.247393 Transcript_128354/m.247393 type:complete len:171 (-) Transcript_128354:96-608(-)
MEADKSPTSPTSKKSKETEKKTTGLSGGLSSPTSRDKQKADNKGVRKPNISKQKATKLTIPIAKVSKYLKRNGFSGRIQKTAPIFMTAVCEYIMGEILELAGNVAKDNKKNRITPRHIQLAVRGDEELSKYLGHVTIAGGGVPPNIQQNLLPKKAEKRMAPPDTAQSQAY